MTNIFRRTTKEEFSHPITSCVMPLIAFEGRKGLIAGSCVLVAPYLAVTAKHVIHEINKHFQKSLQEEHIYLDVYLFQIDTGKIWYVSQVFAWMGTDVAFLRLHPRNELAKTPTLSQLRMTVDPPIVGSEITALGYPKSEINMERNDSEVTKLNLVIHPTIATGKVTEIHKSLRDQTMINFPSFSVNARFAAGMSGGAVFNDKKELCGLVCSGLDDDCNSAESYSSAVSIWPSMLIKMKFNSPEYLPVGVVSNQEYSVLDFARYGHIDVFGNERIEFFKHENGSDGVRRKYY